MDSENVNFENELQVYNIKHKPFIVSKQNSSISEKSTFLKLHSIRSLDIT